MLQISSPPLNEPGPVFLEIVMLRVCFFHPQPAFHIRIQSLQQWTSKPSSWLMKLQSLSRSSWLMSFRVYLALCCNAPPGWWIFRVYLDLGCNAPPGWWSFRVYLDLRCNAPPGWWRFRVYLDLGCNGLSRRSSMLDRLVDWLIQYKIINSNTLTRSQA